MTIMSLVCKKCGKKGIADEAFNSRQGGFLCASCYRSARLKFACCSLVVITVGAIVGLVLMLSVIGVLLRWTSGN